MKINNDSDRSIRLEAARPPSAKARPVPCLPRPGDRWFFRWITAAGVVLFVLGQASAAERAPRLGTTLWRCPLAFGGGRTPAVGPNGIVYAGPMTGTLSAIDSAKGSVLWKVSTNGWMSGETSIGPDGTVHLGLGALQAFDGVQGTWKWAFGTGVGFSALAAIDLDGTVFAPCRNGVLYVLDGVNGAKKREFGSGAHSCGPAAIGADGTVYCGSNDKSVYAFDGTTGLAQWTFATGGYVLSSPAIGAYGTVFIGSDDKKLYALDGRTGEKRWEFATGATVRATPAVGEDGTVYLISSDQMLYAIDGATGRQKWAWKHGRKAYSTPALGEDGTLWILTDEGYVSALNTIDGTVKWGTHVTLGTAEPVPSPVIDDQGVVYIATGAELEAIAGTAPPPRDGWPMFGQNARHTSRMPVSSAPRIITQPESQTVVIGSELLLEVQAAANGALSYRWQKDGQDLAEDRLISGATRSRLRIQPVKIEDAGIYSVIISNRLGQVVSQNAALTMVPAKPGDLLWEFSAGSPVISSAAMGTNNVLYFGETYGWFFAVNGFTGEEQWFYVDHPGDTSFPALGENGWVYRSGYANNPQLAVDAATGERHWMKRPFDAQTTAPAIASDGTLFFGCADHRVYALDGFIESNKWVFVTGGNVLSTPVIGWSETVYVRSQDGTLYALDPATGAQKWTFPAGLTAKPDIAIGSDGALYFGSDSGRVCAIDGITGEKRWEFTAEAPLCSSPVLGLDGTVYIGTSNKTMLAINGATGAMLWEFAAAGDFSAPAVAADGTLYAGSLDHYLYALDGRTGAKKWAFATADAIVSSPVIGPNGTVYIGSRDGWFYAIAGSAPLASSSWPMPGHDLQRTGRWRNLPAPLQFDRVTLAAGQFELRWGGAGLLQSAVTITGPWQDVPAATGTVYQIAPEGAQRFYRLRPTGQARGDGAPAGQPSQDPHR